MNEFITGERLQELCDAYCGTHDDFNYNPRIKSQVAKHKDLTTLKDAWNNPKIIFCYGHQLTLFMEKQRLFQNPYVLVSHNSDENITDKYQVLLNSPNLLAMYAQNVCIDHPKLVFLPIGIANSMWPHGNLYTLLDTQTMYAKTNDIYFQFNIHTNFRARYSCYQVISQKGFRFQETMNHGAYLRFLSTHKFAICPEGNGIDSHRIWECYYLGIIPIVLDSLFSRALRKMLPCIVLNNWSDLDLHTCLSAYDSLALELIEKKKYLSLTYYKEKISQV